MIINYLRCISIHKRPLYKGCVYDAEDKGHILIQSDNDNDNDNIGCDNDI